MYDLINIYEDVIKKVRRTWNINPKTKIKQNKKRNTRTKLKRELRKEIYA